VRKRDAEPAHYHTFSSAPLPFFSAVPRARPFCSPISSMVRKFFFGQKEDLFSVCACAYACIQTLLRTCTARGRGLVTLFYFHFFLVVLRSDFFEDMYSSRKGAIDFVAELVTRRSKDYLDSYIGNIVQIFNR